MIVPLTQVDEELLAPLLVASEIEGATFVRRLLDEYLDGRNAFAQPGEVLFGAYVDQQLVGVGGLNRDPYRATPRAGRLRHLYVLPAYRRRGIGRLCIRAIQNATRGAFDDLTLWTANPHAAALYCACGFVPTTALERTTHIWQAPAPGAVVLATLTVDLEALEETEEFADHAVLWFGAAFEPDRIVLTGDDFTLWEAFNAVIWLRSDPARRARSWRWEDRPNPPVLSNSDSLPF